jgi:hypothetical protein
MIFRFSCTSFALEEVLIQQEREILCGWFCRITQSENVSFENMKNAIIYGSNLASFVSRNLGQKEWISLDKNEVIKIEAIQIFNTI